MTQSEMTEEQQHGTSPATSSTSAAPSPTDLVAGGTDTSEDEEDAVHEAATPPPVPSAHLAQDQHQQDQPQQDTAAGYTSWSLAGTHHVKVEESSNSVPWQLLSAGTGATAGADGAFEYDEYLRGLEGADLTSSTSDIGGAAGTGMASEMMLVDLDLSTSVTDTTDDDAAQHPPAYQLGGSFDDQLNAATAAVAAAAAVGATTEPFTTRARSSVEPSTAAIEDVTTTVQQQEQQPVTLDPHWMTIPPSQLQRLLAGQQQQSTTIQVESGEGEEDDEDERPFEEVDADLTLVSPAPTSKFLKLPSTTTAATITPSAASNAAVQSATKRAALKREYLASLKRGASVGATGGNGAGGESEDEMMEDTGAPDSVGAAGTTSAAGGEGGTSSTVPAGIPASMRFVSDSLRPSPEEYKKLSSKEKRQLRNKISARNFRNRRKEYIEKMEEAAEEREEVMELLRREVESLRVENSELKREVGELKAQVQGSTGAPATTATQQQPKSVRRVVRQQGQLQNAQQQQLLQGLLPAANGLGIQPGPAQLSQADVNRIIELLQRSSQGPAATQQQQQQPTQAQTAVPSLADEPLPVMTATALSSPAAALVRRTSANAVASNSRAASPMPSSPQLGNASASGSNASSSDGAAAPPFNTKKDIGLPSSAAGGASGFWGGSHQARSSAGFGAATAFGGGYMSVHAVTLPPVRFGFASQPPVEQQQEQDILKSLARTYDARIRDASKQALQQQQQQVQSDSKVANDSIVPLSSANLDADADLPSYYDALAQPPIVPAFLAEETHRVTRCADAAKRALRRTMVSTRIGATVRVGA